MELSPSEKLKKFFATSKPTFFKKGDIVLRAGSTPRSAFYLSKGYIKDSSFSSDGREFTLFIFRPSDLFSYNWIFNELPNEHAFRAISDCTVYEKSRESLVEFLNANPNILFMISQMIAIRLRGLLKRIEIMAFGNASQRISSTFYILTERFGTSKENGITIPIALTQKDIAELTGLSRETASIEVKKLIDMNVLSRQSGLYIAKDINKLIKLGNISGTP